jgi:hypothetical protein
MDVPDVSGTCVGAFDDRQMTVNFEGDAEVRIL